jgi:hypothetical protein
MGKIENLERLIKELSAKELSKFREWFASFDAEAWDRQFDSDARAGKLDALAEKALNAHASGGTTKL